MKTPVSIAIPLRSFRGPEDLPTHIKIFFTEVANRADIDYTFELLVIFGGGIAHARNQIVAEFMRGNGRYLMFNDGDIPFTLSDVLRILSHRKHVCGGMYVTREDNYHWVMNPFREAKVDENGLLPVGELGTGALKCYHRSVFEHIAKQEPTLGYIEDNDGSTSWGFFCQGVVQRDGKSRFLTEDYWMDWLCFKHGILVHADTKVLLKHVDERSKKEYPPGDIWPDLPTPVEPMVPPPLAEQFYPVPKAPGTIILALQYWEGDKERAMQLARFIADLEPKYRDDVEFHIIKRFDATFDEEALQYVSNKFLVVLHSTEPHENPGYPWSSNCMAHETMHMAAKWNDAKVVLLFEYDCIPVHKDWINKLAAEWDCAAANGVLVLGSWRAANNPLGHINGNMLFSPKLAITVDLGPVPKMAWDVYYPQKFQPYWARTGLIANRHRETNLSDSRIQTPECGQFPPVLIHGAKDDSVWTYAQKLLTQ